MKSSKPSGMNRPFADLKSLLKKNDVPLHSFPVERVFLEKKTDAENDDALFEAAMADVTPIDKSNLAEREFDRDPPLCLEPVDPNRETLVELKNLVEFGKGFVVENTPEYIEGAAPDVCRQVAGRLHRGQFSIQGFIDLHGMNVHKAREQFDLFLKESVAAGKRGVLIVHGRGLSSPQGPVLKTKVHKWLTRGAWRKWVIAFSSARSCDGGAGATCVLLRRSPLTKRFRKGPRR